jgi:hypothetical protein
MERGGTPRYRRSSPRRQRMSFGRGTNQWTRDGKLRAPVLLGLREDKKPSDVVREV